MKNKIILVIAAAGLAISAWAALPTFKSLNASGTTSAQVIFPADPNSQIRIVGSLATSDLSSSTLSYRTGTGAYAISSANVSGTTITVSQTNGLTASAVLVIQTASGSTVQSTISSFANSTNITLAATDGFATAPGDSVYLMSSATTLKIGATSVVYQGEAIYVANYGRPVSVTATGTSACSLDSISAHYDSIGN